MATCEPAKTWLLVKDTQLQCAHELLKDSGVQITMEGRPLLGAPLECCSFSKIFIIKQVAHWVSELKTLSTIATT